MLYRVVQEELATFLEQTHAGTGAEVPAFIQEEFEAYLACGILAQGFLRLRCEQCAHEKLVAFSCKKRGLCPSCGAKRMARTAAQLTDEILPQVRVRQWVLSLPIPLRIVLAVKPKLLGPTIKIVQRAISKWLIRQSAHKAAHTGAITVIQRFGSAANLNVHLHCLVLDGVYTQSEGAPPQFHPARAPDAEELQTLLEEILRRVLKRLVRQGVLEEVNEVPVFSERLTAEADAALAPLQAASCTYRMAFGPRAGQKVLTLGATTQGSNESSGEPKSRAGCAQAHGASLHADVVCQAQQRKELERLCRYVMRPALSNERITRRNNGNVVVKLKTPYRDGSTHVEFTPQEFMQRLAALVPPPQLHLIRYHGVLAPNAKLRAAVVPGASAATGTCSDEHEHAHDSHNTSGKRSWARLLKRVFDIDIEQCPNCGGKLKLVAAIEEPGTIARILGHLGLPTRAPPRAPAQRCDLFEAA